MASRKYFAYEETKEQLEEIENARPKGLKRIFSKVDKWKLVKGGVSMAASGCATVVVSKYLKANMPAAEGIFDKAVMGVGLYFITGVVGAKVADYCDKELDEFRAAMASGEKEEADER